MLESPAYNEGGLAYLSVQRKTECVVLLASFEHVVSALDLGRTWTMLGHSRAAERRDVRGVIRWAGI